MDNDPSCLWEAVEVEANPGWNLSPLLRRHREEAQRPSGREQAPPHGPLGRTLAPCGHTPSPRQLPRPLPRHRGVPLVRCQYPSSSCGGARAGRMGGRVGVEAEVGEDAHDDRPLGDEGREPPLGPAAGAAKDVGAEHAPHQLGPEVAVGRPLLGRECLPLSRRARASDAARHDLVAPGGARCEEEIKALGRLGWSLRRIEEATGVRRETASRYLRGAGIAVRGPRQRRDPKAASQVPPDLERSPEPGWSPVASACEAYREWIEGELGRGRQAKAIWQDLVDDHGFEAGYDSVNSVEDLAQLTPRERRDARAAELAAAIRG